MLLSIDWRKISPSSHLEFRCSEMWTWKEAISSDQLEMHPNSRTQLLVAWHVRVVYNVFSFIDTVVTHHRSRAEFDLRRKAKSGSVGPHRALHDDIKSCKCEETITRLTPRQVDTNIVIVKVDPALATPRQVVAALAKVFLLPYIHPPRSL